MPMLRVLLSITAVVSAAATAAPTLDPLFGDHAVIQRDRPIHVRGRAVPGERVSVRLGRLSASATADASGYWTATLPAMKAGGPYRLTVRGKDGKDVVANDLLVGDVWLCSGQSNMEWPLRRAMGGEDEAAQANDDQLRFLTVPQKASATPERMLGDVQWQTITPQTAPHASAVCYFMAKELRRTQKVPIGAINSSWGGTRARAWMDEASVRAAGESTDADLLATYRRDPGAAARVFAEQWGAWWRRQTGQAAGSEPWLASDRLTWRPVPKVTYWDQWDPALGAFDGLVWARRRFTLTAAEAAKGATLSLGVIDDFDQTWVNGVGVGASFGWSLERDYRIAPGVLRAGANEVVVNVGDSWGPGGFAGPAEKLRLTLADGTVKALGEGWEYSVVNQKLESPPHAPWESHTGVAMLYNAMIAPLGPLGLKGIAWYQGESDVGLGGYARRMSGLIGAWRQQFGQPNLPFLQVALAGFGKPAASPTASGWAEVINDQRALAAADPAVGLAVATDLGVATDIHPPNKTDVGARLALAARRIAYGESDVNAGPMPIAAKAAPGGVRIPVQGAAEALQSLSGPPLGFELCGPSQQSCRYATARLEGSSIFLSSDRLPVTRVRYGWADYPILNVYDHALLPLPPFELAVE